MVGRVENLLGAVCLGPMAGVTDLPFRMLCKEQGADLVYTEMISAKGLKYGNRNTKELLSVDEKEHPIAVQLFGNEPDVLADAAGKIRNLPFEFVDINMGCPVPKVVGNNEGSALLKNPDLIYDIVAALVRQSACPVSVKLRKGFEKGKTLCVEAAKAAEAAGAGMVAVHGRTREEYYSGRADWDCIKLVKDSVKIPVIGNGDICSGRDAKEMMERTGCDGVMVARAARGNPWIFSSIKAYLESGEEKEPPGISTIAETVIRHAEMLIGYKGEYIGIREMRKHAAWYLSGCPQSSKFRGKMNYISDFKGLLDLLYEYNEAHGEKKLEFYRDRV